MTVAAAHGQAAVVLMTCICKAAEMRDPSYNGAGKTCVPGKTEWQQEEADFLNGQRCIRWGEVGGKCSHVCWCGTRPQ